MLAIMNSQLLVRGVSCTSLLFVPGGAATLKANPAPLGVPSKARRELGGKQQHQDPFWKCAPGLGLSQSTQLCQVSGGSILGPKDVHWGGCVNCAKYRDRRCCLFNHLSHLTRCPLRRLCVWGASFERPAAGRQPASQAGSQPTSQPASQAAR